MSGLAAAWSDFKESFFSTVAYAEEQDREVEVDETEGAGGETTEQKTREPAATQKSSTDQASETSDSKDEDEGDSDEESSNEESGDEEAGDDGAGDEDAGDSDDEGDSDEEEEEDDDDEDDEDEDEDEIKDPLDVLREKYSETVCHPFKHHFDECVERVTKAQEQEGYEDLEYKEDCIEEFFHLQHCLNDHIAPVLFSKLK